MVTEPIDEGQGRTKTRQGGFRPATSVTYDAGPKPVHNLSSPLGHMRPESRRR
jgi:hypothetical protein